MMHSLAIDVDHGCGVLNRVVSIIRRRMLDIDSLVMGRTETPGVSRITVVVHTDERGVGRLKADLGKVFEVRHIDHLT